MTFIKVLTGSTAALFMVMWIIGKFYSGEWELPSSTRTIYSPATSTGNSSTTSTEKCDEQSVTSSITNEIGSTVDNEAEIEYARQQYREKCGY